MEYLTKEDILGAADLKYVEVKVPEWGGVVRLRSITGADRDAFEAALIAEGADGKRVSARNIRARLISMAVVDAAGKQIFTEADIDALGAKSARALDRVYVAASKLNAFSQADLEDLEKN